LVLCSDHWLNGLIALKKTSEDRLRYTPNQALNAL